jgi:hypothetical protein
VTRGSSPPTTTSRRGGGWCARRSTSRRTSTATLAIGEILGVGEATVGRDTRQMTSRRQAAELGKRICATACASLRRSWRISAGAANAPGLLPRGVEAMQRLYPSSRWNVSSFHGRVGGRTGAASAGRTNAGFSRRRGTSMAETAPTTRGSDANDRERLWNLAKSIVLAKHVGPVWSPPRKKEWLCCSHLLVGNSFFNPPLSLSKKIFLDMGWAVKSRT